MALNFYFLSIKWRDELKDLGSPCNSQVQWCALSVWISFSSRKRNILFSFSLLFLLTELRHFPSTLLSSPPFAVAHPDGLSNVFLRQLLIYFPYLKKVLSRRAVTLECGASGEEGGGRCVTGVGKHCLEWRSARKQEAVFIHPSLAGWLSIPLGGLAFCVKYRPLGELSLVVPLNS